MTCVLWINQIANINKNFYSSFTSSFPSFIPPHRFSRFFCQSSLRFTIPDFILTRGILSCPRPVSIFVCSSFNKMIFFFTLVLIGLEKAKCKSLVRGQASQPFPLAQFDYKFSSDFSMAPSQLEHGGTITLASRTISRRYCTSLVFQYRYQYLPVSTIFGLVPIPTVLSFQWMITKGYLNKFHGSLIIFDHLKLKTLFFDKTYIFW